MSAALHIDFETRSAVNLPKAGAWVYAEDPSTDIWCACYALGDEEVRVWLPGDPVPADVALHIIEGGPLIAHNAMGFERIIWKYIFGPRYGWPEPELEQWHCTAAMAAALALPRKLDEAARCMGLKVQKDMQGHRLMMRMSRPRAVKPDGSYVWWDDPVRVQRLVDYCKTDVLVERALHRKLYDLSPEERELFLLDARINERGIRVDLELVGAAERLIKDTEALLEAQISSVTGGKVTSAQQAARIILWMKEQGVSWGEDKESIAKVPMRDMLNGDAIPDQVREVLEIRKVAAKNSTAKIAKYRLRRRSNGRMSDNALYHGASTGRWAGRGAQLQNLPRGNIKNKDFLVDALFAGRSPEWIETVIAPPLNVVSECLRAMLTADPGNELIAADFAAIEARVLAWLAREKKLLQLFRDGGDTYRHMASQIYGAPAESFSKDGIERQLGKKAILGGGYGMGWVKFQKTCREDEFAPMEIDDELAQRTITSYREGNPRIVALWTDLNDAAMRAVRQPGKVAGAANDRIRFAVAGGFLWMRLPSGRRLAYARPSIGERKTPWDEMRECVLFWGVNSFTRKWEERSTYGGFWTENAVQAIARDLLASAMLRLEAAGYTIVLTVHDEIVSEIPAGWGSQEQMENIMCELPKWAEGCPVNAESWRGFRFRK